jgi:uncharacterized protein YhhL (DUF1145 family)
MSFFKRSRKFGPILLGFWLIVWGMVPLLGISFPYSGPVLNLLAIAAGVLILIDR